MSLSIGEVLGTVTHDAFERAREPKRDRMEEHKPFL